MNIFLMLLSQSDYVYSMLLYGICVKQYKILLYKQGEEEKWEVYWGEKRVKYFIDGDTINHLLCIWIKKPKKVTYFVAFSYKK